MVAALRQRTYARVRRLACEVRNERATVRLILHPDGSVLNRIQVLATSLAWQYRRLNRKRDWRDVLNRFPETVWAKRVP